jgi:predicted nucleic acid-binding Zn ribbon protein
VRYLDGGNSNRFEVRTRGYSRGVGRAADRYREERRKTLGDWAAFCLACGYVQRYVEEREEGLPSECPACGGELRSRCPGCGARIASAFAIACEDCSAELRAPELFGGPIRRARRN